MSGNNGQVMQETKPPKLSERMADIEHWVTTLLHDESVPKRVKAQARLFIPRSARLRGELIGWEAAESVKTK